MKKMKMKLDSLNVESFVTAVVKAGAEPVGKPTVITYGYWTWCCTGETDTRI